VNTPPRPSIAPDARVITLAKSREPKDVTSNIGHPTEPVVIALSLSGPQPILSVSEGSGHLGSGGTFWMNEILTESHSLQERWESAFERADALWVVPLFHRLATGEVITEQFVIDAYRSRHGTSPAIRPGPIG
jgi:hypothetical protein